MKRLLLADSINKKPTSPEFRDLLSSSYKYGLTLGTEKAESISLTDTGKNVTMPTSDEMKMSTRQKSILQSEVFKKIYSHYNNNKFPQGGQFFENTLESQFHVPREYIKEVIDLLNKNGKYAGIIRDISGSPMVMLDDFSSVGKEADEGEPDSNGHNEDKYEEQMNGESEKENEEKPLKRTRKVFIAHGKNEKILEQIKTTLKFGGFEPVIAKLRESTAIPVSEKVMNALHECEAGIINISADEMYKDEEGQEQYKINENVLIEIGAAFVLYKKKVILVADKRIKLPSNLQGLYVCNYEGDSLDWESGLKLQKTLTEFTI